MLILKTADRAHSENEGAVEPSEFGPYQG